MTVTVTDPLTGKVIDLIVILTGQDGVFTAFDITKQLRQENPTMNIPHKDIRDMVLAEYNNTFCDDYERTLTDLTVGSSYVYHPDNISALSHALAVQRTSDPVSSVTPKKVSDPDSMLTVENRLNIDKTLLNNLNLVAGHLVKVTVLGGIMSLTPTTDPTGTTLVVNADGRLRINESTLTSAFGRLPKKYDIYSNGSITAINVKDADPADTD